VICVACAACRYHGAQLGDDTPPIDADPNAPDADPNAPDADPTAPDAPPVPDAAPTVGDVIHLSPAVEAMLTSSTDVVLTATIDVHTDDGTIDPPISGVKIIMTNQEAGTPVMVMQAHSWDIQARIDIYGDRPLIIVATTTIRLSDTIDASAQTQTPGPGGFAADLGPGAGDAGAAAGSNSDSGGAGGSFGTSGGTGGVGGSAGGTAAGPTYGDPDELIGGSGGGTGSPCGAEGGAGGGAFQLYAGAVITLDGGSVLHAGAGGGVGGGICSGKGASGGGGGAGGMIFLQAPQLHGSGAIRALGGGGGGAADDGGGNPGGSGGDPQSISTVGGTGGNGGTGQGGGGGGGAQDGAAGNNGATVGTSIGGDGGDRGGNDNGGGGGGGLGRVYYATSGAAPSYAAIPAGVMVP